MIGTRSDRLSVVARHLHLQASEIAVIVGAPEEKLRSPDRLSGALRRRFDELLNLAERIDNTFEPRGAEAWLSSPNRVLQGATPLEELRAGHLDVVDAALESIDSGVYI